MAASYASEVHGTRPRCHHCGRVVRETRHTRTSYRVDYYSMHTGPVELSTLSRHDSEETFTYLKLLHTVEIFTCAECYHDPEIREECERLFRPELTMEQEA